jgi:signal peptidase II
LVFLLTAMAGLLTDLVSKDIAFRTIAEAPVVVERDRVIREWQERRALGRLVPTHKAVVVVPNLLEFSLVLNPGAVFGIGAGQRWFFVAFTIGALGLAVWMFGMWTRPEDAFAHAAIGLLVAGGIGNLYDRLLYACVRDFIHPVPGVTLPRGWEMPLVGGREVWPYVSNLADLWLLIGIGMLMWYLWRAGRREAPKQS